jgi:uncharacterized glyoxalase superfamily protein PhnB
LENPNNQTDHREITPYFTVDDADRFIAFVQVVLGGEPIKDDRYPDGRVQHARLQIGASVIMINQSTDDYPPMESQLHIRVADADDIYAKALLHGAKSIMAPNVRPHGERMAGIEDPCGNIWWVASV